MKVWIYLFSISVLFSRLYGEDNFPFDIPKNFELNPSYIVVHHPVSTNNITAQLYFDQGLTLLYAFNHDAAFWSFKRSVEVDPKLAMGYWGMAYSLGRNINMNITPERHKIAFEAVRNAVNYSKEASLSERDYIQALANRYTNVSTPDLQQLNIKYSEAMGELVRKYPDDPDATVLYAESILDLDPWNQWTNEGKPQSGGMVAIEALESVLKRQPQHLGANHFYIHAIEASPHPEYGLMCAERLKKLMPASGHLLHMPSHIYILVGDYRQAAECNEEAVAADREYIRQFGPGGVYPVHYLSHNLFFLSRSYSMMGRYNDALQAAEELETLYLPHFQRMPELEYYASCKIGVYLRFKRWDEMLKLKEPPQEMKLTNLIWHFGRALAFANSKQIKQAQEEAAIFNQLKGGVSAGSVFGYNQATTIMEIADNVLKGKLAQAQNNPKAAIDYLNKAVVVQDALHYNEPPDWFFPVRESLGGAYFENKSYQEAEEVFRKDLTLHPRNGRSLFGLYQSLIAQSKAEDGYWVQQEYQKAWMYSDEKLKVNEL